MLSYWNWYTSIDQEASLSPQGLEVAGVQGFGFRVQARLPTEMSKRFEADD